MSRFSLMFCLAVCLGAASAHPAAMDKVVSMIEELQAKVLFEGKEESRTYDTFACFCKDTSKDKNDAITSGQDAVDSLSASIGTLTSERADLDDDIAEYQDDIARMDKELKAAKKQRDEEHATYQSVMAELTKGHTSLVGAIGSLKSARKGASMVQLESALASIKAEVAFADALGLARVTSKSLRGKGSVAELLQQGYKKGQAKELLQHLSQIIEILDGLQEDFASKIAEVNAQETHLSHEHNMFKENNLFDKAAKEKKLKETNELKSKAVQQLGKDVKSLTEASGTLTDDKAYMMELNTACNRKAAEWAQRSQMRAAELTALGEAVDVLRSSMSWVRTGPGRGCANFADIKIGGVTYHNNVNACGRRCETTEGCAGFGYAARDGCAGGSIGMCFIWTGTCMEEENACWDDYVMQDKKDSLFDSAALAQTKVVSKDAVPPEDENEEFLNDLMSEESPVSFAQLGSPRHRLAVLRKGAAAQDTPNTGTDERSKVKMVTTLLKERGLSLKSQMLLNIARNAGADPLKKVKQLVQELIERLLQEAADEANQKGWCDKEMGKAKKARKQKTDVIKKLNEDLAANEAKRDKLTEDIAALQTEVQELQDSLAKVEKERFAEAAENKVTIIEAREGAKAVKLAESIISKFYATSAKASSLAQAGAAEPVDLPDAGFKGSYKGAGEAGGTGGIMGMLEVIIDDQERVLTETTKAEAAASKEFLALETQTKVSTSTKTVTIEAYQAELIETTSNLQEDKINLQDEQTLLDKTLQELGELRPACIETGMSYADKIAKREQEMESLKEALSILEDSA